jgi:hypothetical protein
MFWRIRITPSSPSVLLRDRSICRTPGEATEKRRRRQCAVAGARPSKTAPTRRRGAGVIARRWFRQTMGSDGRSKELAERVGALAAGFLALGLERGARIRAWSLNRPKWALTQLAAAKPGLFSLPSIQPIASANWNWRARRRCCSGDRSGRHLITRERRAGSAQSALTEAGGNVDRLARGKAAATPTRRRQRSGPRAVACRP